MITFERIDPDSCFWERIDRLPDRTLFQTSQWLNFVHETQAAEPVVIVGRENGRVISYFTGLIIKKCGVRILGSPLKGWTTPTIGFNFVNPDGRLDILQALPEYIYSELKCHYFELVDDKLTGCVEKIPGYQAQHWNSFRINLSLEEEDIYNNMKKTCRWSIRKASRLGLIVEEAIGFSFADEYYEQLKRVFSRQGLVPTYSLKRVKALLKHLLPTRNLLLLRVKTPDGICVATGIFPGYNQTAYWWGGANLREYLYMQPIELMVWYAIRYWKKRGVSVFDLGGAASYKKKFGGHPIAIPRLMHAKLPIFFALRNIAQKAFKMRQRVLGRF